MIRLRRRADSGRDKENKKSSYVANRIQSRCLTINDVARHRDQRLSIIAVEGWTGFRVGVDEIWSSMVCEVRWQIVEFDIDVIFVFSVHFFRWFSDLSKLGEILEKHDRIKYIKYTKWYTKLWIFMDLWEIWKWANAQNTRNKQRCRMIMRVTKLHKKIRSQEE